MLLRRLSKPKEHESCLLKVSWHGGACRKFPCRALGRRAHAADTHRQRERAIFSLGDFDKEPGCYFFFYLLVEDSGLDSLAKAVRSSSFVSLPNNVIGYNWGNYGLLEELNTDVSAPDQGIQAQSSSLEIVSFPNHPALLEIPPELAHIGSETGRGHRERRRGEPDGQSRDTQIGGGGGRGGGSAVQSLDAAISQWSLS